MCDRWPNCGHTSRYGMTPADPRMQPGWTPPPKIKPSYGISVIPLGDLVDQDADVHESFKIDRYGNPYKGHTTIRIGGKKKSFNW